MKVDCHVHITPPDISANWTQYAEKEPYFSLLSNSKVNKFASAEDVTAMLETEGFDRAVVFGFGFKDLGLCRYVNDYVIEKVKQYPDKLTGFAAAPPCDKAAYEIQRCFNAGLRGVGELFPAGQDIDLSCDAGNFAANAESSADIMEITSICKSLDIPLLLHVNEPVGHSYAGKTDVHFKKLETFITKNPGLKIILAHFGGGIFLYETMKEIKTAFANVYYDTAAAPFIYDHRIYNAIKSLGICDKLLFGSDFPILPPSRYLSALNESSLSDNEKKPVLGLNAQKLLGI